MTTTVTRGETTVISPADLQDRLDKGDCVLVDVRTPQEFEAARIEGALNLPLDTIEDCRGTLGELDTEIILLCKSGARAGKAAEKMAGSGTVSLLEGGLDRWESSGFPVENGRSTWTIERQVRLVAGGIVLSSVVASIKFPKAKWVGAFIGAGLTFAGATDTCGMGMALARMPWNRTATADVEATLAQLSRT
jgi:rhodanese-related sulfurtransferase